MWCRRNQIPGKHSPSLTTKNIYLCGADRIKCPGSQSSVDDEEQLRCAEKNQMLGRVVNPLMKNNYAVLKKSITGAGKSLSMTIMINFALLTKSNARKAQSILDGEEQFCCAEEVANAGQVKSTLDDHLEEILWFR